MESVHSAAWPQTIHQHQMWECNHLRHNEEVKGNIIHALNKFSTRNDLEHHYLLHHGRRASSQADPAELQRPQSSEHDDQQDTCPLCCFEVCHKGLAVTVDKTDEPGSAIGKVLISTLEQHIAAHLQYLMVVSLRLRSVLGLHFDDDGDGKSHEADSSMSSPCNPHVGGTWDEDLPLIAHGSQSKDAGPDSQALEESATDHLLMDEDSRASAGELNIPEAATHGSIADADEWKGMRQCQDLPEPDMDPLLREMGSYSLWDRAYHNLRMKDRNLVESYDDLLSKGLERLGYGKIDENTTPLQRRTLLQVLIANSLERMDQGQTKYHIADIDITVDLSNVNTSDILQKWKNIATEVNQKYPRSAMIWVGVCTIFPMFLIELDNSLENQMKKDELGFVISYFERYAALESPCQQPDGKTAHAGQIQSQLTDTYQAMLEFIVRHVLQFYQSQSVVQLEWSPEGGWNILLSEITDSYPALRDQIYSGSRHLGPEPLLVEAEKTAYAETIGGLFDSLQTMEQATASKHGGEPNPLDSKKKIQKSQIGEHSIDRFIFSYTLIILCKKTSRIYSTPRVEAAYRTCGQQIPARTRSGLKTRREGSCETLTNGFSNIPISSNGATIHRAGYSGSRVGPVKARRCLLAASSMK
jgi:hypothetical protein